MLLGNEQHYSPKFPMSDTFFRKLNDDEDSSGYDDGNLGTYQKQNEYVNKDSVKPMAPNTHTNISSENYMMEDSMNLAVDEQREGIFEEYARMKYELLRMKAENDKVKLLF